MGPYEQMQKIPVERCIALGKLLERCEENGVVVTDVTAFLHGFSVTFEGMKGDACLHDATAGRYACAWDTMEMPWDPQNGCSIVKDDILVNRLVNVKEIPPEFRFELMLKHGKFSDNRLFAREDSLIELAEHFDKQMCDGHEDYDVYGYDRWSDRTVYRKGDYLK